MTQVIKKSRYQLLHDDAFDWLSRRRKNSIQAVVTDPPYGLLEYTKDQLEKRKNGKGGIWRLPHDYDGFQRIPIPRFTVLRDMDRTRIQEFHARLAPLLLRVLVPGGHVIMASQNLLSHLVVIEFTKAGFEIRGQLARVVKTLRGGDRPKGAHKEYPDLCVTPRGCWEPWLLFRKPCEGRVRDNLETWGTGALRRPTTKSPFMDLIVAAPAQALERQLAPHPSIKPQALMRQIVRAALPLGKGTILDPFMGSGSTIAAAESLKLKSIGVELREDYFRMAETCIPKLAKLPVKNGVGAPG